MRTMSERDDLQHALAKHRELFRFTVRGLDDDRARLRPTVSELSLGGLVKHVTATERQWADFVVHGPGEAPDVDWSAVDDDDPAVEAFRDGFRMKDEETLAGLLEDHARAAAETDALVASVDLDEEHPLPEAPWNPPGERWSNRRVFVHLVAETAQHAGHADVIRETLDGQKSMG